MLIHQLKTHQRLLIFITISIGVILPLIQSCSKEKRYHIGVSQCSYDDWRLQLNDEILREALLYEDLDVEIVSAYDDPRRQEREIRDFINKGVDVIIASPQNDHDLNGVLKEARDNGIKVILFDRDASEKCYDVFVGADNNKLGYAAGKYLLSCLGGGGKFLEIQGSRSSSPTVGRHEGFSKALAEASGAQCLARAYGDWSEQRAEVIADSLLRLFPDADAVYAHNDRMAVGVRKAADRLGLSNLLIAGTDAVPEGGIKAVADGKIDATFMYPTAGKELVDLGYKAATGETLRDKLIISSALPVDHTNAEILLQLAQSIDDEKGKIAFLQERVNLFTTRHNEQKILLIVIAIAAILLAIVIFVMIRLFWIRQRHQDELKAHYQQIEQQHDQLKEQSEKIREQRDHIKEQHDLLKSQRDDLADLNERLREATQSKLIFFTNVSHDLRTPLTLIDEPIKRLLDNERRPEEEMTLLRIADKNVRILKRLINQILDFRKIENGKLSLNLTDLDLKSSFSEWAESFRMLASKRDIRFLLEFNKMEASSALLDSEKMERIFFNLMSNAFKFTPANGSITASVSSTTDNLRISISNSGKGINPENIPHIFDRFYQADSIKSGGSGIGLAVVKAFTELHGGSVMVESQPDRGTTFTVNIPIVRIPSSNENINSEKDDSLTEIITPAPIHSKEDVTLELDDVNTLTNTLVEFKDDKPTLLIIDDTNDIRTLLRILFQNEYNILEAPNGEHGIRLALKYCPDLIICDLMMPGIGGQECVRRIKQEETTAHIPIIMLTACELDEQRCENLNVGVDVYITKPFDAVMLEAQCRSLIENRQRILSGISPVPAWNPASHKGNPANDRSGKKRKVVLTSDGVENEFYSRFLEIINEEISNPDISIEEIGSRMGMSRVHFYRKIKNITGYSPVEILRNQRLKFAHSRLISEDCTVAEVAYSAGFTSPSYFSRCFKEQYGELPLDLQKRTSKSGL